MDIGAEVAVFTPSDTVTVSVADAETLNAWASDMFTVDWAAAPAMTK